MTASGSVAGTPAPAGAMMDGDMTGGAVADGAMADDVLALAASWLRGNMGVALATVIETWGSAPCPAGSRLAVSDRGHIAGSVSAGCVEAAVIEAALDAIVDRRPRQLSFGVSDDDAWSVGLACGGTIRVFVEAVAEQAA